MDLSGKTVYGNKGDQDFECTIRAGKSEEMPFIAFDNNTGAPVTEFTAVEAKKLSEGILPGWEIA